MKDPLLKERLLQRINFLEEYTELLGPARGSMYARKCYNKAAHKSGDNHASLGFSPQHGGYKCFACGESGDLFKLYMIIHRVDFPTAFRFYLGKYNLLEELTPDKTKRGRKSAQFPWETLPATKSTTYKDMLARGWDDKKALFMYIRYGLTLETLKAYGLAYNRTNNRVMIPVWLDKRPVGHNLTALVNIIQQDAFRVHCQWGNMESQQVSNKRPDGVDEESIMFQTTYPWVPTWKHGSGGGKFIQVQGHGSCYLWPFDAVYDARDLWIVGGMLKAANLRQAGLNACSFTTGESSYPKSLLGFFSGRRVRVLMDPDESDRGGGIELCRELAAFGAYVEQGLWNPAITEDKDWPYKGDVNDLMRIANQDARVLDDPQAITWKEIEREYEVRPVEAPGLDPAFAEDETPPNLMSVRFDRLIDPLTYGQWVEVDAVISGRTQTPFAVPSVVTATCKEGQRAVEPKCFQCGIFKAGFVKKVRYSVLDQLDFVGKSVDKIDSYIATKVGVPRGCPYPIIDKEIAAVDSVILSPTVLTTDVPLDVLFDNSMSYHFGRHPAYVLSAGAVKIGDNETYRLGGKILADPRRGNFTFAVTRLENRQRDLFKWDRDPHLDENLHRAHERGLVGLIEDIRDNVTQIYGQDLMLTTMLLHWFLPFTFSLGVAGQQERICPSTLILGDTNTGKSKVFRELIRHFGIGRLVNAEGCTMPGLIGGNADSKNGTFAWGILPISHRTIVGLDEFHKISETVLGSLTNLISSGVAERTLNTGSNRAACWVRLMYLANPKSAKPIRAHSNAFEAAIKVMVKAEDLGRLDMICIQPQISDDIFLDPDMYESQTPALYDQETARYHLQWAWSRSPSQIKFQDPRGVIVRASTLSREIGSQLPIFLPAGARFKLARIAAGFAMLMYSQDADGNVLVQPAHTEMAAKLLQDLYLPYLQKGSPSARAAYLAGLLPEKLAHFLDRLPSSQWRRIKLLATDGGWSHEDLEAMFQSKDTLREFLELVHFDLGLFTRIGRFWHPKYPTFYDGITTYVLERERLEDDKPDEYYDERIK